MPQTFRNQNKQFKGRGRNRFSRFIFYFAFFLFLGTFVYILIFSQYLVISETDISGLKNLQKEDILKEIEREAEKKYLGFFPQENLLLFPSEKTENLLRENWKEIRTVKIKKELPGRLKIVIYERTPSLIVSSGGESFILDENGEAYDQMTLDSEKAIKLDLFEIQDESGKKINPGQVSVSPDFFQFANLVRRNLKDKLGLKPGKVFRTPGFISGDLKIKLEEGWEIYFNTGLPPDRTLEILKKVLEGEAFADRKKEDLEYVDIRINNKVYLKFKNNLPKEAQKEEEKK